MYKLICFFVLIIIFSCNTSTKKNAQSNKANHNSIKDCITKQGLNLNGLRNVLDDEKVKLKDIDIKVSGFFLFRMFLKKQYSDIAKKFLKREFNVFENDNKGNCILEELIYDPALIDILEYFVEIRGNEIKQNYVLANTKNGQIIKRNLLEICLGNDNDKAFNLLRKNLDENLIYEKQGDYNFLARSIILNSDNLDSDKITNLIYNDEKLIEAEINLNNPFIQSMLRGKADLIKKFNEKYPEKCDINMSLESLGKDFEETFQHCKNPIELSAYLGYYNMFKFLFSKNSEDFTKKLLDKIVDMSILDKPYDQYILDFDRDKLLENKNNILTFVKDNYNKKIREIINEIINTDIHMVYPTIISYLCEIIESKFEGRFEVIHFI